MSSEPQNPGYITYEAYDDAKYQFDRTVKNDTGKDNFVEIIKNITNKPYEPYLKNKTLISLNNVLNNYLAFISGKRPNYCKYINFWLNKEVQNTDNHLDASYINIFQNFSHKLSFKNTGRYDQSCYDYISNLGDETINKMKFLYSLYDAYKEIISSHIYNKTKTCDNLVLLAKNYRDYIDKYYEEDKNLYNNLEHIIVSIDKITGIQGSPCTQSIYFTKPTKLVQLLEKKAREEAAEKEKQAREEEDKQAKEAAAKKQQVEPHRQNSDLLQSKDLNSGSPDNGLQEIRHDNGELPSTSYRAGSQVLATSRLHSPAEGFETSEWIESPTGSLLIKGYTPRGQMAYTMEGREQPSGLNNEQEDKGTTRPGTFFGSSGFPGYITEVLGSVEPGPVLGVSGGMGALFLLFKYTPVGSFFGGRRRRFRQIPTSFGGFQPGDFANFQEYDGGSIGYSPMGISPFAE